MFIAYVTKYIVKIGNHAVFATRDEHPAHCKQTHKPDCFQRNGFAARVWSRNDNYVVVLAQTYGNGHNFAFVNQRMACFFEVYKTAVVENRQGTFIFQSVLCLAENYVYVADSFFRNNDLLRNRRYSVGKCLQNSLYFRFFFESGFSQGVVQLHYCHWFHKKSCARCRLIVYNSVYKTFVFLLYGNNVPVATQSNDAVLQILGKFAVFGVTLQLLLDVGVYRLDFFSDSEQLFRRFVVHFLFAQNAKINVLFQFLVYVQGVGTGLQQRYVCAVVGKKRRLQVACRAQRAHYLQQLPHRKAGAYPSERANFRNVVHRKVKGSFVLKQTVSLLCFFQRFLRFFVGGKRTQFLHLCFCNTAYREVRNLFHYVSILKFCQSFRVYHGK